MPFPYFNRAPRRIQVIENKVIELDAAPSIGQEPEINWLTVILPGLGSIAIMGLVSVMAGMSPIMLMFTGPMMIMGIVVSILNYRGQKKKFRTMQELRKDKYLKYLQNREERIKQELAYQQEVSLYNNPSPDQWLSLAAHRSIRLWERTQDNADFMSLRVGIGTAPALLEVKAPKVGFTLIEDDFTYAPQQLAEKYKIINNMPVCSDLRNLPTLGIVGERRFAVAAARNLIVQAAALHGYDELKIVCIFTEDERTQWDWVRWLPHTFSQDRQMRYLSCAKYEVGQMLRVLDQELRPRIVEKGHEHTAKEVQYATPHYLFVIASNELLGKQPISELLLNCDPCMGISSIFLASSIGELPYQVQQIMEIDGYGKGTLYLSSHAESGNEFQMDQASIDSCDSFARCLAPLQLPENNVQDNLPGLVTFLQGFKLICPELRVEQLNILEFWKNAAPRISMSVPIGVKADGTNFYFDINEKADGPNALVAGMVGSGKSEMLQSWILSMAVLFSPQQVSFVLIDFKGTGLIQPFEKLPHLAGAISDLDTDITRNLLALQAEKQRRKALFDKYKVSGISGYLKLYEAGIAKENVPYLMLVIDEYAEFKSQFPEFTSEVDSLIRTGRALGICIILATQNPTGIITQQTEYNIKSRWCLRVASVAASKEVLGGHDDAAHITNPGCAVVRVGVDEKYEFIQSFYTGAPYIKQGPQIKNGTTKKSSNDLRIAHIDLLGHRTVLKSATEAELSQKAIRTTEIKAVVEQICYVAQRESIPNAWRIWYPPMPDNVFLPELLKAAGRSEGILSPIVGLSDDPRGQAQEPLRLPLSEEGHAAICGAPGSGKTTFLQTLAMALCCQYTPDEVNLYMMDFGSWTMLAFRDFPHVGGVALDNEEEKINRMAKLIEDQLDDRRKKFGQLGVSSVAAYRKAAEKSLPYIVLLLDNFSTVYSLYPDLEAFFQRLAREGSSYGVYFVVTANNKNVLGYRLSSYIRTVWALQMPNKTDYSDIVGRTDGLEPKKVPGRGLCNNGRLLEFQTALPVDEINEAERATKIRKIGAQARMNWNGECARLIPIMPDVITYNSIKTAEAITLGLDLNNITPVGYSFGNEISLLISCHRSASRQALMRMLCRQLSTEESARVYTYGMPDTSFAGISELPDAAAMDSTIEALAQELKARQERRKNHSAAQFASIYLLLNNWGMCFQDMSEDSAKRLRALQKIGQGLGVHVIIADEAETFSTLQHTEPITMTALKGDILIVGGSIKSHEACLSRVLPEKQKETFEEYQGYLITANQQVSLQFMAEQ